MFRDIERMFEEMHREMEQPFYTRTGALRNRIETLDNAEGYRREVVNGEVTEYILDDGEWKELGASDDDVIRTTKTSATIDLSGYDVLAEMDAVAEATFNNGVLDVTFEASTETDDSAE